MFRPELLESKRTHAAPRQMKEGSAAHCAQPHDNRVVASPLSHPAVSCTDSCNSAAADS